MIPTHWLRTVIFIIFVFDLMVLLTWAGSLVKLEPAYRAFGQTLASLGFLFGFYVFTPFVARMLAPYPTRQATVQGRVDRACKAARAAMPVFAYDHSSPAAVTVGLFRRQAKLYLTAGMVDRVSDLALQGLIAHEQSHVDNRHIMGICLYAFCFALGSYGTNRIFVFLASFISFLAMRRFFEYQADAGACKAVGKAPVLAMLEELERMKPTKRWHRWLTLITNYPTLPMRIQAIHSGKPQLF